MSKKLIQLSRTYFTFNIECEVGRQENNPLNNIIEFKIFEQLTAFKLLQKKQKR